MSDGGKGSRPRPKSVDHMTFSDNWDAIFGKEKKHTVVEGCGCRKCLEESDKITTVTVAGALVTIPSGPGIGMIVCPKCGNKRCPRATDHRYECTGSNDPGQEGSIY